MQATKLPSDLEKRLEGATLFLFEKSVEMVKDRKSCRIMVEVVIKDGKLDKSQRRVDEYD